MKEEIHPKYIKAVVRCACGNTFETRSTKGDMNIEICSSCHPFFTGKQKFVDSDGRIEKFKKKYAKTKKGRSAKQAPPQAEPVAPEEVQPQEEATSAPQEPLEQTETPQPDEQQ